ncbi:hypothetical protein HYC85_005557 [Camellia sinensis]|uniref:X8 domain-containing protein n=1 Tax=Camellia sinensis TaxID=4442 RepID=A0A7J7HZU5_CAMSI|nr:hypothetical protein HYC85_005557 [Camellia sinensis]
MLKMVLVWLSHLFFLGFIGLTGASKESVEHLTLHDSSLTILQSLSHSGLPVAVSVAHERLNEVSNSIDSAEKWVRTHVLTCYPATKITTIVAGNTVLCKTNQEHQMGLVLPSLKNIYHSLTRWGLEREIKVSASFSSNCLNLNPSLGEKYIKPLLDFLQNTNSTYSVNPPPNFQNFPEETLRLVSFHTQSMNNHGFFFNLNKINVLMIQKESKPMSRKLSFMESKAVEPFPARPTPLAPTQSPIGYSVPVNVAKTPLPPLVGISSPPPPFSLPPIASPPYGPNLPPCNPSGGGSVAAPPPVVGKKSEVWCVAKPSVPAETLQVALDYACGEGGADCEEIKPNGGCYSPDTIVAHASYAFNSYWQKSKRSGGTCSFGGTAMLINADPSSYHSSRQSHQVVRRASACLV